MFDAAQERLLGVQMVSDAGGEIIQIAAKALATQISVHPSQTERFIKIAAHDHHEICAVPERHRSGGEA